MHTKCEKDVATCACRLLHLINLFQVFKKRKNRVLQCFFKDLSYRFHLVKVRLPMRDKRQFFIAPCLFLPLSDLAITCESLLHSLTL